MNALETLKEFYPEDTPLRRLLIRHSEQVRDKALQILKESGVSADPDIVSCGAMLHDIGIGSCHAPGILCTGTEPYILHGVIGARLLRARGPRWEVFARICERHTGAGITAQEAAAQKLPLPPGDYLPETNEEKLICLADKFYSKSGDMKEKALPDIRRSLEKFGPATLDRFDALCRLFRLS